MEEIDVRHIHVLEFPKLLLWTDRDLEYFLEEMSSEECRMNNDIYDVFIKEVEAGKDYQPEEAFNLAYYECVRISLAKYPESRDIIDVLELDIQHNQSHVNYGFTDLIMNMVWAMLHSTNTATRFADKLHSYLVNKRLLKYSFRRFFTPNDFEHIVYPYDEKKEPKYNIQFTPCPDDSRLNPSAGDWGKLTVGYKQHLIGELLMLWPKDKRDNIRKCIMDERDKQVKNFNEFTKKSIIEIIDQPESHLHINIKNVPTDDREKDKEQLLQQIAELKAEVNQLAKEKATLEKNNHDLVAREEHHRSEKDKAKAEKQKLIKKLAELENSLEDKTPEKAFNASGNECFTKAKMGLLIHTLASITDGPIPTKSKLVPIISAIGGWEGTSVSSELRKAGFNQKDIDAVAKLFEAAMPKFASEIRNQIPRRSKSKK